MGLAISLWWYGHTHYRGTPFFGWAPRTDKKNSPTAIPLGTTNTNSLSSCSTDTAQSSLKGTLEKSAYISTCFSFSRSLMVLGSSRAFTLKGASPPEG